MTKHRLPRNWGRCLSWCSALAVLLACASQTPIAVADRRSGLGASPLIEDRDDVFLFPQLSVLYPDVVSMDLGLTRAEGNALVLVELDPVVLGLSVHRADFVLPNFFPLSLRSTLGEYESSLLNDSGAVHRADAQLGAPRNVLDFLGSVQLAEDHALGTRFAVGTDTLEIKEAENSQSNHNELLIMSSLGYSYLGALRVDTSVNVTWSGGERLDIQDEEEIRKLDADALHLGATFRLEGEVTEQTRWGVVFSGGFFERTVKDLLSEEDIQTSDVAFNVFLGVGPIFTDEERYVVAMYAFFAFENIVDDANSKGTDDDESSIEMARPGFHVAFEVKTVDWLWIRAAVEYALTSSDTITRTLAGKTTILREDSYFGWSAGLGMRFAEFAIDATFEHRTLFQGLSLLAGESPLFALMSISYQF